MKTLTLIVLAGVFGHGLCLPFFGINVQITGADYSLSPKIAANFANASNLATALITPAAPMPVRYLYSQNQNFATLNDLALQFVYGTRNMTTLLGYIFNNLTAAAADNNNYPGVFTNLNAAVQNAISFLSSQNPFVQNFAQNQISTLQTDISSELNNLLTLIGNTQTGISQFKASGLALSSANVLKYIPAPAGVTASLTKLFTLSSQFAGNISFVSTYMNNSYNVIKQSDATFTSIEATMNSTLNASYAMVNATELYVNQTFNQFLTTINTTYANFKKTLPAALTKDPQYVQSISNVDSMIYGFVNTAVYGRDAFYQQLEDYKLLVQQANGNLYQSNIGTMNSMRFTLFTTNMINKINLACAQNLVSTSEARFRAMGGPARAFVCTQPDVALFSKINASVAAAPYITSVDLNATVALFNRCLRAANITTVSNNPNIYPGYSMIQCFENLASSYLSQLGSTYSMLYSTASSLFQNWGMFSSSRMSMCTTDYTMYLNSLLYPLYNNYSSCIATS